MTARILAVADAFDTIRGARPYRPALPRDKARQIIQTENIITVWVGDVSRQPPGYDACVHAGGADTASEIFRMIEAGQLEI